MQVCTAGLSTATSHICVLHLHLTPPLCLYHVCIQIDEVPPGQVKWQLTWDQMLTAELAYHRQVPGAAPDGVIIHRKYRGDDDVLVYDVRCRAHTRQPQELHEAITCARAKYYLEPLREIRGWRVTPVLAAEQQVGEMALLAGG